LIAADSDNSDVVNILSSWGTKLDIEVDEGWDAIKTACSKACVGEERQKIYL
jgi:hypothetical protein